MKLNVMKIRCLRSMYKVMRNGEVSITGVEKLG